MCGLLIICVWDEEEVLYEPDWILGWANGTRLHCSPLDIHDDDEMDGWMVWNEGVE